MDSRVRKVWRDLAGRKARSITTLLGLAIGFWGMATVAIAWVVLSRDLGENFARTLPPDLVVRAAPGSPPTLDGIAGLDAIADRPLLVSRIEAAPNLFLPLHLYVVDDFGDLPVARFFAQRGPLPPPRGDMLIERAGDIILRITRARAARAPAAGNRHAPIAVEDGHPDALTLQLPGGGKVRSRIAGTVFDPGLAPSNQEQIIYGYVSRETAADWLPGGIPQRLLVRTAPGQAQAVAREIGARLQETGNPPAEITFPDRARHPHQFQMDSILFLLAGLGGLAFGLGAVLAVNLVNAILTQQIRQIGSLKAMGATTVQVARMYLGGQSLLGLAAAVLALPFAVMAGQRVCRVIAGLLNFDILTRRLPWTLLAGLLLAGALLPVLAAWWPVRRWSRMAVRNALDHSGGPPAATSGWPGGGPGRLPLPLTLFLGLRNALRRPARFALCAATIGIGALVFMLAMNMRAAVLNTAATEEATVLYDLGLTFEEDTPWPHVSWMTNFPVVDRVELWPATRARTVGPDALEQIDVTVLGVPADTWAVRPNLIEGAWLSDARPFGAVATHRLMKQLRGLAVGDRFPLQFGDRQVELELVGVEKRFGPASLRLPLTGYLAATGADPAVGRIAFLDLDEATAREPAQFIPLLESHFPLTPLKVREISTSRMAARIIRGHLDAIVAMLAFVAALMLAVSGLGMASGTSTSVIERTREIGVLRAIGATPATVFRLLTVETLLVALSGCALALLVADPLSRHLEALFGTGFVEYPFDHRFSLEGMAVCILLVALLAVAATLGPARLVVRGTVSAAVGYE